MPKFLTQQEIYRILQRESPPDDVYPDGQPTAFFSTADQFSVAKVLADAYANQSDIYDNSFPNTANSRLSDFEFAYFGYTLDASLTLEQRRDRTLTKIRTRRRTTPQDMIDVVHTIIDSSILVEIGEWNVGTAGWMLDVSQLDIDTILNEYNGLERVGPDLCTLTAADYGLTQDEFARLQDQAYTYEVLIYGYTLSAEERLQIENILNISEPARSAHIIVDGLDPADSIGGTG